MASALVALLGLALGLAPAASLATSFITTSLSELATLADVVVRVRVTASESRWLHERGPSRIVTFHEARVLEVLRGSLRDEELASGRLTLGTPGGLVGELGQRVPDAPSLEVGREYILLLGRPDGPGGARGVAGLRHGVVPSGPSLNPAEQASLERALPLLRVEPSSPGGAR